MFEIYLIMLSINPTNELYKFVFIPFIFLFLQKKKTPKSGLTKLIRKNYKPNLEMFKIQKIRTHALIYIFTRVKYMYITGTTNVVRYTTL